MKKNTISISSAIQDLLMPVPLQDLIKSVVKKSISLSSADFGAYFVYDNKLQSFMAQQSTLPEAAGETLEVSESLAKVFQTKKSLVLKPEGSKQTIKNGVLLPLFYDKKLLGVLGLFIKGKKTISEQLRTELELYCQVAGLAVSRAVLEEEMQQEIAYRNKVISQASHDIRNPLTSLGGYIQMLHRKMADQDTVEAGWVREIYDTNGRLTKLVIELLDVRRIEQKRSK
jgi:K+-sensing histidine kinase KdpD